MSVGKMPASARSASPQDNNWPVERYSLINLSAQVPITPPAYEFKVTPLLDEAPELVRPRNPFPFSTAYRPPLAMVIHIQANGLFDKQPVDPSPSMFPAFPQPAIAHAIDNPILSVSECRVVIDIPP